MSGRRNTEQFLSRHSMDVLDELLFNPGLLTGDNLHLEGVFLLHRYAETLARQESIQRNSNLSGKRTQVK
ncbi:hypothetical protein CTZ24_02365 [Pantoea phytobeneficialis]|uniref:Uncharacterized protein n=1 Tax=Pantoea phytobeneficialis TaxID=2052056 RepID=A0AAP9H214_9GAMM|nr:hypothetical protein CTZ24_02365 [Pantoea phytobeneficialis]